MSSDPAIVKVRNYQYPRRNFIQKKIIDYLSSKHLMDVVDLPVIEAAVVREIDYLNKRLIAELRKIKDLEADPYIKQIETLQEHDVFAGDVVAAVRERVADDSGAVAGLDHISKLYGSLLHRLTYLLDPYETIRNLDSLDPYEDRYQLACLMLVLYKVHRKFTFSEGVLTIAVSESISTFFHSTRQAEEDPLKRQTDTARHYYYFIEWGGAESYHGSESIRSMNKIHGRYYIHNEAIKLVLEVCGMYEITAFENLGKPMSEKLQKAYFHVYQEMGKAMNIQGLCEDFDDARRQLAEKLESSSQYSPYKKRMYWSTRKSFYRQLGFGKSEQVMFDWIGSVTKHDPQRRAIGQAPANALQRTVGLSYVRLMSWLYERVMNQAHFASLERTVSGDIPSIPELGPGGHSIPMSPGCPFFGRSNKGFPEDQIPLLSEHEAAAMELTEIPMDEVARHNTIDDLWVVIDGIVYDLSSFAANHPGGQKVLLSIVGKDGKSAFERAKHSDITRVFALNYRIGRVQQQVAESALVANA